MNVLRMVGRCLVCSRLISTWLAGAVDLSHQPRFTHILYIYICIYIKPTPNLPLQNPRYPFSIRSTSSFSSSLLFPPSVFLCVAYTISNTTHHHFLAFLYLSTSVSRIQKLSYIHFVFLTLNILPLNPFFFIPFPILLSAAAAFIIFLLILFFLPLILLFHINLFLLLLFHSYTFTSGPLSQDIICFLYRFNTSLTINCNFTIVFLPPGTLSTSYRYISSTYFTCSKLTDVQHIQTYVLAVRPSQPPSFQSLCTLVHTCFLFTSLIVLFSFLSLQAPIVIFILFQLSVYIFTPRIPFPLPCPLSLSHQCLSSFTYFSNIHTTVYSLYTVDL